MSNYLMELYDPEAINNIVALLHHRFDEVVFFTMPGCPIPAARREALNDTVKKLTGKKPYIVTILQDDIPSVADCFERMMKAENTYVFDISGGSEIYSMAIGYLLHKNPDLDVHICRYLITSGKEFFWNGKPELPQQDTLLSFSDFIRLNGASVLSHSDNWHYDFGNADLQEEILRLWKAVGKRSADWNRFFSLPRRPVTEAGYLQCKLPKKGDHEVAEHILRALKVEGFVEGSYTFRNYADGEYVSYKLSELAKTTPLYKRGGTLLELYCCLAAYASDRFREILTAVKLDYVEGETIDGIDPCNELDITMLCGNVPIFASCKNTSPENNYLYEIMNMAKHFGQSYAKPVLLTSMPALPAIKMRAKEMGVILLDDLQSKTPDDLIKEFRMKF